MRRLRTLLALVLLAALTAPAAALAGPSEDYLAVYKAYQAKGTIDGCDFSAAKLASAKKGVPPDIDTYAPDFQDALDTALRRRASGACDKGAATAKAGSGKGGTGGGTAAQPAPAAPGAPATPAPPSGGATGASGAAGASTTPAPPAEPTAAPAVDDGSVPGAAGERTSATGADDAPFPLVLLAVLVVLALLAALVWGLLRFFAFDPPWLAAGRHATAEAGWRASASWAEFTDWVRFGR